MTPPDEFSLANKWAKRKYYQDARPESNNIGMGFRVIRGLLFFIILMVFRGC